MSSAASYRPEAWAYVDPRTMRTGAAVVVPSSDTNMHSRGDANGGGTDGGYCDQRAPTYVDECGRPCAAPLTPRVRWSPPASQSSGGGMTNAYDVNQTATPDMALIIERLLDDLDREREARARAEERTTVTTTASSFTTTPIPGAPPGAGVITQQQHVQGPAQQLPTAPLQQQQQQPQPPLQQTPQLPPQQYTLPPAPMYAPSAAPSAVMAGAPVGGAAGTAGSSTAAGATPPPGTTSNRTLLLALIPVVIIALLFGAWVIWRLSGIEKRLSVVAAHATSSSAMPLVSPVVSPVATAPAAPAPAAPQQTRGMLAVDTNNQYYYARPIVP